MEGNERKSDKARKPPHVDAKEMTNTKSHTLASTLLKYTQNGRITTFFHQFFRLFPLFITRSPSPSFSREPGGKKEKKTRKTRFKASIHGPGGEESANSREREAKEQAESECEGEGRREEGEKREKRTRRKFPSDSRLRRSSTPSKPPPAPIFRSFRTAAASLRLPRHSLLVQG